MSSNFPRKILPPLTPTLLSTVCVTAEVSTFYPCKYNKNTTTAQVFGGKFTKVVRIRMFLALYPPQVHLPAKNGQVKQSGISWDCSNKVVRSAILAILVKYIRMFLTTVKFYRYRCTKQPFSVSDLAV